MRTEEEACNWVNTTAADPRAVTTSAFGPFRREVVNNTYKQPIGDYFGAFANITYADGSNEDMLGTTKNTYNLGGYFENEHFNARLNYTFRSSLYSGLDRSSALYQDDIDKVSALFGYKFYDSYSLALDALNTSPSA